MSDNITPDGPITHQHSSLPTHFYPSKMQPAGSEAGDRLFFKKKTYAQLNVGGLFPLLEAQQGFSNVPLDAYVPDKSRYKDLVRFTTSEKGLTKAPHGELFHPINSRAYGNDASRNYGETPNINLGPIQELAELFVGISNIPNNEEILVQRQRVVCSDVVDVNAGWIPGQCGGAKVGH